MSTKILLLLALAECVASSKSIIGGTPRCLCQNIRDDFRVPRKYIKNLEVFPPSNSCENLEIILNLTNGKQFCLNPSAKTIKEFLRKLRSKRGSSQPQ